MQNQTTPGAGDFVRYPGQGYLFYKMAQPDARTAKEQKALADKRPVPMISIWSGWLVLPGGHEVQVRATGSTRDKRWTMEIREFGDAESPEDSWKKLSEFTLPSFGNFAYVDGEFKVGTRSYKVRMFKTDSGYIRLRLPQVVNVGAAQKSMY